MPSRPRSRAPSRRYLYALVVAALATYPFYLALANWFLSSDLSDRVINRRPEKLTVEWGSARTWWPGLVVLEDVAIDGANRQFVWDAHLDRVRVDLSLSALPRRVFRTREVAGDGLVFRLRRRDADEIAAFDQAEVGGAADATAPPRERPSDGGSSGRGDAARDAGTDGYAPGVAPATAARKRNPWSLDLHGLRISDLKEITIQDATLSGDGQLRGSLEHEIRGPLRFDQLALSFAGARLTDAEQPVAEDVTFTVALSSSGFEPGEDSLREILGGVSADLALRADVRSVAALNYVLRKPDWLSFTGRGRLDTAFRVRDGEVQPGGHLDFAASALEARMLDWTADGLGTIAVRLPSSGDPAKLDVTFDRFAIRRGERDVAYVRGEGLEVAIAARAIDLEEGFADLDLRVDIPRSEVDFVAYNSYLPESSMRIERGRGTLRSWFEYSEESSMGRGEVELAVAGAAGVVGDLDLEGDLELHTIVNGGDFAARRFDVSGSSVKLSNVRVAKRSGEVESEGWWATLATSTARVDVREPLDAEIMIHGRMRDAKPFLTALASRRRALFWLDELIGVKDVAGKALLVADAGGVEARDVEITGNRLEIYGDVANRRGQREGLLYFKYGPFAAALEMAGGERDWKLLHPWRWFDDKRRARWLRE